jgi:adenine phosphoribosyltransferase
MIRKAGKLPGVLVSSGAYVTEYSTDETVIRLGSVKAGDRVVLVDDLIATGGTALAGFDLVDALGATVHEFAAMVSLPFLDGVGKIHAYKDGKFKDVSCFTMVDDNSIGPDMCRDPPSGTPRVVKAEEAKEWAEKIAVQK